MRRLIALMLLVVGATAVACTDTSAPDLTQTPELQTANLHEGCMSLAPYTTFTNMNVSGGGVVYYYTGEYFLEWRADVVWTWDCNAKSDGRLLATCEQVQHWNGSSWYEGLWVVGAFDCRPVYYS